MTAGSPPIPVHSFLDAMRNDYDILVVGMFHYNILRTAQPGTGMNMFYNTFFEQEEGSEVQESQFFRKWSSKNLNDWAMPLVMGEEKTLFFCADSCAYEFVLNGTVVALNLDDAYYALGGFYLQKDSEFSAIFNYYLLKAFEHGILEQMKFKYNPERKTHPKIGMKEPEPLRIHSTMFLFSILAMGIIVSLLIAVVEMLIKRVKEH